MRSKSFDSFSAGIKVFSATDDREPITHRLHKNCNTKINLLSYCPECNREISANEVVSAHTIPGSDESILLTQEELETINVKVPCIDIHQFVPTKNIDPTRFSGDNYFIGVDPKQHSEAAYRILFRLMMTKHLSGIGYWSYRGRERLVLVTPEKSGVFVMQGLYFESELRNTDEVPKPQDEEPLKKSYLTLCSQIIEHDLTEEVNWTKYPDLFTNRLTKLVDNLASNDQRAKIALEARALPKQTNKNVVDLMESLKDQLHLKDKKATAAD